MSAELGALLRQLRCSQRISLEITAQQTGVTRVTLHRWETGQFGPRLPELETVLRVLQATPQQRRQALALLEAPRAVARMRQEIAQETRTTPVATAGTGGLLRALRLRQGLTVEAAAQRVGINKSTLTRWERGDACPAPENLHTLCSVLQAAEAEETALTGRWGGFLPDEAVTIESTRVELRRICMLAPHDPEEALKDLLFLRLESQAWPLSDRPEHARLLAEIRAAYAGYLAGVERYAEAGSWADRALERVRPCAESVWWMYAALASARCEVFQSKRPTPNRGLQVLRAWLPELRLPDFRAWALRDMAEYALLAGDADAALHLSAQSCQVVEASGPPKEVFVRRCDRAMLLLSAGLPHLAVAAVPADTYRACDCSDPVALYPDHRVRMALVRVQAFLSLQKVNAAHDWLQRAYSVLETGYLSPRLQVNLRIQADKLALQF